MTNTFRHPIHALFITGLVFTAILASPPAGGQEALSETLRRSLTFAVTFDNGFHADFARGDATLYSSMSMERKEIDPTFNAPEITRQAAGARSGMALKFTKENKKSIFYKVQQNLPYMPDKAWSGSVSYFLKLNPEKELPDNYVDPLQITEKAWNDAAFWNDFTKDDRPRKFRLGVLADLKVWNPENKDFDKLPDTEKPAVVVHQPPFQADQWTHILITFENFNTGRTDGSAKLYINGILQGEVKGRNQKYTWNPEKAVIFLGLNYAGLMDDVMIFDRPLTPAEAALLAQARGHDKPLFTK